MFQKLKRVEILKKSPKNDAIFYIKAGRDKAGLDVKYINSNKGRGVFAMSAFTEGEFVLECRGQLINSEESERRQRICHKYLQAFMFDFLWHGKTWTIDAAWDDGTMGRLVNDDHINPNCKMKRIFVNRKPHLCLFALRDITHGEEITYKYRSGNCPWRTQVAKCKTDSGTSRLESDGSSVNYPKCLQHNSPSHIQDQASSITDTTQFISTNLPRNKLKKQLVNIVPFKSTQGQKYKSDTGINHLESDGSSTNDSLYTKYSQHKSPSHIQKAYITTQDPLTETAKDLCRMLWEQNPTTRVNLTKLCEVEQAGLSRMIQQFQFTDPKHGLLGTGEGFNDFIDQVHKTKVHFSQDRPVTVHYSARVGRTGVFITFSIILEKLRDAKVVNSFQTVKTLHTHRPATVLNEDQYQLCYRAALE
ncbi:Receptor-type tyrosine-protein phosphatase F [Bagarius yarrelli]|uniref:Receptor-type tyrosine-protein phosphatase F n=1 Tax=Bagarius yarrelli TaxID=175774 RepID=A0A556TZJ3_BAGYA|nr:Receptor-type tyrosine-protein phosphatase F [Bagarius yarrelli]